jgi:predicted alpha-1,6-mannanase (GH76 family)
VFGHPTTVPVRGYGVNDMDPTDPAIRQTGRVGDIDWAERASCAEGAIVGRHLRRIGNVVPGTRIGRVRWPRRRPIAPFPWHYWWQAHLLDCLVDAHRRDPRPSRSRAIAAMTRSVRLRNAGSWINRYYDDIAWFGLAVQRAGGLAGRSGGSAVEAICTQLGRGWTEAGGGGLWWRRGDNSKNAPANGPAAILLARTGQVGFAAAIVDWMSDTLVDPDTGLLHDGVRIGPDGEICEVDKRIFSYCQGVYLGACVELAQRDGHQRWADRAIALVDAVRQRYATPGGVLPGVGGGDGGLFGGITARYLADAALRRPELSDAAAQLVLASAEAAWDGRLDAHAGPVFSADWRTPAPQQLGGLPEADLSVQLGGWMLMEAAARVQRGG